MNENMLRKILKTNRLCISAGAIVCLFAVSSGSLQAEDVKDAAGREGITTEDGKFYDKDDNPTWNYTIEKDKNTGKEVKVWDWLTYNGNRRYHAECHVCHGPLGLGGTFAPALAESLKTMTYDQFREVVVNGRTVPQADGSSNVMPTFGTNKNVMCYLDDFYVYLKARASGELGPIPIQKMKKHSKTKEIKDEEYACFGWD